MLKINIDRVCSAVVEQELRGKGREGEAIYFHFDVRMSYYHYNTAGGYDKEYHTSRGLHLLYCALPHSSRYITVFSSVRDNPFDGIRSTEEWTHESSHDSGWRNIRVFNNTYFHMAQEINDALTEYGYDKVAPAVMHQSGDLGGHGLYSWVPVKVSKDPTDDSGYRKQVVLL